MLHMIEIEVTSLRKELYCMAREAWPILGLWWPSAPHDN